MRLWSFFSRRGCAPSRSPGRRTHAICDLCRHYNFNADKDGAYTGDGRCEHPAHPRPSEPYYTCRDFSRELLHE